MGLFNFIKTAGEKLFSPVKSAQAAAPEADAGAAGQQAADAIKAYVEKQDLGLGDLAVAFDAATEKVTLTGTAPSQEAAEKAALAAGNVEHVASVDNQLQYPAGTKSQYHDVVRGDTLSAIAKKYYGNANKYPVIFEANKPMLTHPDKIYPGQKLRIPAL